MSEATIRAALDTIVSNVSNVGEVHDYERWSSEWDKFLDLFKTTIGGSSVIRGWTIGYNGFRSEEPMEFGGVYHRAHVFKVRGYFGLDDSDESEKAAAALAEDVCDALDNATTIRAPNYYYASDAVLLFEPRMFGGTLVHYAEITVEVWEIYT